MQMDVWLGHFAGQRKLTEHWESTVRKKGLKKNEVVPFAATRVDLGVLTLTGVSQMEKH